MKNGTNNKVTFKVKKDQRNELAVDMLNEDTCLDWNCFDEATACRVVVHGNVTESDIEDLKGSFLDIVWDDC